MKDITVGVNSKGIEETQSKLTSLSNSFANQQKSIATLEQRILKIKEQQLAAQQRMNRLSNPKSIKEQKKTISRIGLRLKQANLEKVKASAHLKVLNGQMKAYAATTKVASGFMGGVVNWLQKGQEAQIGFNGAALSMLFLGMQLRRTFDAAMKSLYEGYKQVIPEQHKFNIMTNALSANWEYFKFQLFDAFAKSRLFQVLIEGAIGTLKIFQQLPEGVKTFITVMMGALSALGLLLFVAGTVKLGIASLVDSFALAGAGGAGVSIFTKAMFLKVAALLLVAWAIGKVFSAHDDLISTSELAAEKSKGIRDAWAGMFDVFFNSRDGIDDTVEGFDSLNKVSIWLGNAWNNLKIMAGMAFNGMVTIVAWAIEGIITAISLTTAPIRKFINLLFWAAQAAADVWGVSLPASVLKAKDAFDAFDDAVDFDNSIARMKKLTEDGAARQSKFTDEWLSTTDAIEDYRLALTKANDTTEDFSKLQSLPTDFTKNMPGVFKDLELVGAEVSSSLADAVAGRSSGSSSQTTINNEMIVVRSMDEALMQSDGARAVADALGYDPLQPWR